MIGDLRYLFYSSNSIISPLSFVFSSYSFPADSVGLDSNALETIITTIQNPNPKKYRLLPFAEDWWLIDTISLSNVPLNPLINQSRNAPVSSNMKVDVLANVFITAVNPISQQWVAQ